MEADGDYDDLIVQDKEPDELFLVIPTISGEGKSSLASWLLLKAVAGGRSDLGWNIQDIDTANRVYSAMNLAF
jgi:hypothetical protein